jgi:catechol 2,3-dioxygenase-like lactoylglutathione lyase family enzyme
VDGPLGKAGGAAPGREGRNVDHFCFRVEPWDEKAIRATLAAAGVRAEETAMRYGAEGKGPSIYFNDPEGNMVELKGPASSDFSAALAFAAPVLRVADLPRSLAFYRDQLGFAVEFEYGGFYAGVVREGCHIHLKCGPKAPRDQAAFEREEGIDVCLGANDARSLSGQCAAAGVSFTVPLRQMPYGKEFYVRDPDGYILGFVQPGGGG